MRDFTLTTFRLLLMELKSQGYTFQPFRDFLKAPAQKAIVLRHDVDARKLNSLQTARIEAELSITGTYYFRIVSQSYDAGVISQIAELGHEIGYHYEDLALAKGNMDTAIQLFEQHLAKLRQVASIDTICMHGSPLSKYDNRDIWKVYDYKKLGILGEPYLDLDFNSMLYLTDTGRMWDGDKVSIRDRVKGNQKLQFHSTYDIIQGINKRELPDQMMINVHPQRWGDGIIHWTLEKVMQNIKNIVKKMI